MDIETLNRAIELTEKGRINEAEALYLDLYKKDPNDSILLSALGLFYVNIKNYAKASEYLKKACELKESLGTVSALGFAYFEQRKFEDAIECLEKALNFGESVQVYDKLILALFHKKNYKKAIEYANKMYEKYPQNVNSVSNMVKALTQSGELFEAEKLCVEYLKENSDSASLWLHLGFLKELIYSDDKQACQCYKIASELGNNDAYYNMAVSYQKQRDYVNAEMYYNKMLKLYPHDIDTKTSLGMCYLAQKKFKAGYDLFFLRDKSSLDQKTNNPWKPFEKFESEVVVICDQGFGDHIQFSRYLPYLKQKIETLFVAAHDSLRGLFEKNFEEINFISYDEIDPQMQSIRITDLAYALQMDFDNIPKSDGFLDIIPDSKFESKKLKIGLCWEAGSAGIRTMINRTINVKLLEPILNLDEVEIYSLQVHDTLRGNEKYSQMINLAKDFRSFEDTAKAIKNMDLVISVDTSVAHLAGAMGIKTFLMLPYVTDWRWFDDNKTTPWYDSVEIFKQTEPVSWENVIGDIVCRLKEYSS